MAVFIDANGWDQMGSDPGEFVGCLVWASHISAPPSSLSSPHMPATSAGKPTSLYTLRYLPYEKTLPSKPSLKSDVLSESTAFSTDSSGSWPRGLRFASQTTRSVRLLSTLLIVEPSTGPTRSSSTPMIRFATFSVVTNA